MEKLMAENKRLIDGLREEVLALGVARQEIARLRGERTKARQEYDKLEMLIDGKKPIPMLLWCPSCGQRHVDEGEFATKPHHTHACQGCGMVWRQAVAPTVGVWFLPGFKNASVPERPEA